LLPGESDCCWKTFNMLQQGRSIKRCDAFMKMAGVEQTWTTLFLSRATDANPRYQAYWT
jgi:hypothetical protein